MNAASGTRAGAPQAHALTPVPWHAVDLDGVIARLEADPVRGLATAEAVRRLAAHGANALDEPPPRPWWRNFLRQFEELVIWILVVAAAIAGVMGDWADAAAIVAIVLVNAIIGFLQEERAQQALAALQRMAAPTARVVRDGTRASIPAREVVPGDLIDLEAGDQVPADARLLQAFGLFVQESSLTGESMPVDKSPAKTLPAATPLGDRLSLVHAGTVVAAGSGSAVVVATGMATEIGRIAGMLERSPPESTPLQRRLAGLGRILVAVCLAVVGMIFLLELSRGGGLGELWRTGRLGEVLLRAVSLAVAAVPEGLPAVVTLVLALGLQRMVARNALVRRLPSVETLGSVTVICSDKTGTLTRNEMTVRDIITAGHHYRVTGVGYEPRGEFHPHAPGDGQTVGPAAEPDLRTLLWIAARCTTATLLPGADGAGWQVIGDPTEGALVVAAVKGGVAASDPAEPTIFEIPFDSTRKRMSVVVRLDAKRRMLATKGAPEAVLADCVAEQRDGRVVPLNDERRLEILAAAAGLAEQALRVLSLAWRDVPAEEPLDDDASHIERGLVSVGLVGMIDPPRDEAGAAVQRCRSAGIRPVMITGDHPATALAVGRELGLVGPGTDRVVTGMQLDALDDSAITAVAAETSVYARVSAEHKLRIVRALQRLGEVVAMTGDGVNDAPAVKAADIGIAMGITGTDVTREAADMVLTDDNFASIVSAVEEGRGIYDNIQKFMHYLLACNAGEVLVMFVAAVAGWPAPLAAIQILWLNLVTDGLPALALGLEPPEPDIMTRPPRPPREPVIPWIRGVQIVAHGVIVAAVAITAFWITWQGDEARLPAARTVTFCVAAFSQLFFAIGCRSDRSTAFQLGFFGNPALLLAVVLSGLLQFSVVMLPPAQPLFEIDSTLGSEWGLVLGLALVPVTVIELVKCLFPSRCRPDQTVNRIRPCSRCG
ncbi:MAG: cation-translocating P-type ATPase [Planctomycetia bacterium]|nr:cation-translocating P-type ATPase [Planctomycetia bacterium]